MLFSPLLLVVVVVVVVFLLVPSLPQQRIGLNAHAHFGTVARMRHITKTTTTTPTTENRVVKLMKSSLRMSLISVLLCCLVVSNVGICVALGCLVISCISPLCALPVEIQRHKQNTSDEHILNSDLKVCLAKRCVFQIIKNIEYKCLKRYKNHNWYVTE